MNLVLQREVEHSKCYGFEILGFVVSITVDFTRSEVCIALHMCKRKGILIAQSVWRLARAG